jgi:hypothetical protein
MDLSSNSELPTHFVHFVNYIYISLFMPKELSRCSDELRAGRPPFYSLRGQETPPHTVQLRGPTHPPNVMGTGAYFPG